jgi:hypothetical protein
VPTARELLEQADALMRRNRDAGAANEPARGPGVPLGGPSVSPPLVSPRTIQREPIAPSMARTGLPVDPSVSPSIGPAATPPGDQPERTIEQAVPVLTDAVPEARGQPVDLDDVPVLTDVVEEIEMTVAGPVDDEAVDADARGEPSIWFEPDEGEGSVLGPAPDSVAVVPEPVIAQPPLSPPLGRDPLGFDQPAPGFKAEDDGAELPAPTAVPDEAMRPWTDPGDVLRAEQSAPSVAESTARAEPVPAPSAPGGATQAPGASLPSAADEARVRAIAEEIGMQVLQRIDIFTDTTLRERLGERLKPVVERVSAELVDALNQHVGELLRAHVAEAIEREIETWHKRGDGTQ